jgi:hypothetical protein
MAKLREVQAPKATVIREGQQLDIDSQMVVVGDILPLRPSMIFVIVNAIFGLQTAAIVALGTAALLGVIWLVRKEKWHYALAGFLGVGLAAG